MLNYTQSILKTIESAVKPNTTRNQALHDLRNLSLSDFGEFLMTIPNQDFPKLSYLLPRMASSEVQESWTGTSGISLLKQTVDFVRSMSYNFAKITGTTLEGKKILDYGCGYGRISRLMYYFIDEDNLFAADPWDKSIALCHNDGLNKNFVLSEYLPGNLPFKEKFDLIFAFSVFTHLSEKATRVNLNLLSNYLNPGGVIVITIRPVEYWGINKYAIAQKFSDELKLSHLVNGFAFIPHNRPPVDGDITYGDTSLSFEWLQKNFDKLRIKAIDRSFADPYQIYVFLQTIEDGQ